MIKYKVVFNYDRTGNLRSNGTASVLIRAYLDGKNRYFNTGVYLRPDQWDKKTYRVKNHQKHAHLNSFIYKEIERMEAFEVETMAREGSISLERLGDYSNENLDAPFSEFYAEQLKQATITQSSFTDQRQTLIKLRLYKIWLKSGKELGEIQLLKKLEKESPEICFSELSYRFIHGFNAFLSNQLKLRPNTIAKHHKNLKKYVHLAISFDYLDINKNPYKKFKVEKELTARINLSETELGLFEVLEIPKEKGHLELIRDFFLFCCYTGLRYSDASRITRDFISETKEGMELYLKSQKTSKPYHMNLRKLFPGPGMIMSRPEAILKRYLDIHVSFFGDDPAHFNKPVFQGFTNQYINRELKNLAELLPVRKAVKENISIHVGRHTFGTIMAGKVQIPILQELMQHSKIKETMIYVHMNKQMINRALDVVKW